MKSWTGSNGRCLSGECHVLAPGQWANWCDKSPGDKNNRGTRFMRLETKQHIILAARPLPRSPTTHTLSDGYSTPLYPVDRAIYKRKPVKITRLQVHLKSWTGMTFLKGFFFPHYGTNLSLNSDFESYYTGTSVIKTQSRCCSCLAKMLNVWRWISRKVANKGNIW